jgi:murein DD-endopeptidase MepM/ murein hydrolase activator NlpD
LATLLERIALISPEIASDLQKATSANRDLNKVLDEQIEKRERLLNAEIAETKLALANAEQALAKARRVNEVLEDQAAAQSGEEAGLGGAMLATTLQIKDQAAAVESLTKALDALLQAKQSLAPSGEASGSSTPAPNLGGDSKDASNKLVEQWRESLEDIKASQESTWSWSTEREREFWASKLALTKAGTDAYRVVRRTVNQLDQQLAKEAHEATLATARAELDAAEQSGADRIAIARRIVAEEERVHGAGSPQAIAAARAAAAEERKVGEESIALRLRQIQGQIDAEDDLSERRVELARRAEEIIIGFYGAESEEAQRAANRRAEIERRLQTAIADDARRSIEAKTTARLDDLDEAEKHIRDLREMGLISAAQERADLLALENAKFEIRVAALREILALGNIEEAERRELLRRLEQLERDHYARVGEIENEATKDVSTKVDGFLQPLMSTWEAGLAKMLQGQLSFSQAVQGIWGSLRQAVAQVIAKMLIDYLAMLAKKLLMTVAMKIKELLVHQATAKASTAASVAQATTEVGAKGASAAAGAASSAASIPGIGWIIAIPAALAVLGAVLAMKSNIGSAAGGWDIGNFAPVAQLHANEMVLPAHLADRVRNMTEPDQGDGGAVGSIAVTIQALDGASVERVLRDNDREFGRVIERLVRQRKVAL